MAVSTPPVPSAPTVDLTGVATTNTPLVVEGLFKGDVVIIISQTKSNLDGIDWTAPELDDPLVLIAGDNKMEIVNTAEATPIVVPTTPSTGQSDGALDNSDEQWDDSDNLAKTGKIALPLGVLTLLTLLAGAGLLVGARRRV